MRKIREILRLRFAAGLSARRIARSIDVARSTVSEVLQRASDGGLGWPLPLDLDDAQLEARLYPSSAASMTPCLPDFAHVHRELARAGVTRDLLWREYKAQHPEGLGYTAFCVRYRHWRQAADPVMRFEHRAGEKLFVDYAGHTVPIIDRHTGEVHAAQIFVAVLGCSNFTFAEATASQALPDWLGSHVRALRFFGGVPQAIVPDNLRSAVSRAHRYEPELNPAYAEFAEHYGVTILPARVRRPRDKAKVEGAVLIVERWILACLRNRQFFSLGELNAAIRELLNALNTRPFKKLAGSRQSRFIELDRPALAPLPPRAYEFATWKCAKVHPDYHIQVDHAYYSVPYTLIAQQVDVRITAQMLEIFKDRQLIATHPRATRRGARRTVDAHRPVKHRAVIDLTLQRLLDRAAAIGPATAAVLTEQFNRKAHPEEALRSAQGILRLEKDFSAAALEAACIKALALNSYSYRLLRNLLTTTSSPDESEQTRQLSLVHDNVRGSDYFH